MRTHRLQELHRDHRPGLGVLFAVHHIADVVEVAGDRRQLRLPLRVAQPLQRVVTDVGHQADVPFAGLFILRQSQLCRPIWA